MELALHMYRLPRLTKLWTHLERQQGGVGLRGPGERQLEVDRCGLALIVGALPRAINLWGGGFVLRSCATPQGSERVQPSVKSAEKESLPTRLAVFHRASA